MLLAIGSCTSYLVIYPSFLLQSAEPLQVPLSPQVNAGSLWADVSELILLTLSSHGMCQAPVSSCFTFSPASSVSIYLLPLQVCSGLWIIVHVLARSEAWLVVPHLLTCLVPSHQAATVLSLCGLKIPSWNAFCSLFGFLIFYFFFLKTFYDHGVLAVLASSWVIGSKLGNYNF